MTACGRTDAHLCTAGAHTQSPRCAHCAAPDVIRDDGGMALVCRRCIAALGRIAADPASAHPDVLARLQERSLDVVHLDTRIEVDAADPWATPTVSPVWHWTASWASDDRLITGKRALP